LDISSRIPKWDKLLPVYGIIVLMIYGWTLYWFFWRFPSWLYFLTISEILAALSYSLATNLVESLALLGLPILISLILPKRWFFDVFVARATALLIPGLAFMMHVAMQFQTKEDYPSQLLRSSPAAALVIVLIALVAGQVTFFRKALELLADRASIFAYLSIPISLIAVLAIVLRLVF
jgi:hypothetical protein